MNATNGSIHPGLKVIVATCSLALMSAFVWYSHIQAQSKSIPVNATAQPGDAAKTANTPSDAPQPPTEQPRTILLSGPKSYSGSTMLNSGTLAPPSAPNPPSEKQSTVLMPGSKVGILTTTTTTPVAPTNPQPPTDQQRSILMMSSKSGTLTTTTAPGTSVLPANDQQKKPLLSGSKSIILTTTTILESTGSPQKSSESKTESKQPMPQAESNETGAKQPSGDPAKPVVPKDVLMFGTKAPAMPLVGTERTEKSKTQKTAPPVQQQKSGQK